MSEKSKGKDNLQNAVRGGQIKKILIVRTQKLGDMMTFLPTIEGIHRMFPSSHITLLCRRAGFEVARRIPYLENILVDDFKRDLLRGIGTYDLLFISSQDSAWVQLKKQMDIKYAIGVLPESLKGICLKHRLQYNRLFTVTERYKQNEHEVNRNLRLLDIIGQDRSILRDTNLWITAYERESVLSLCPKSKSPLVVISPSGSKTSRNWAPKHFASLCELLIQNIGVKIVLAGQGELAEKQSREILANMKKPVLSLVNQTTFGEFSALIERTELLISVDSGPIHIASYLNRPVIAIFGPGDYERWRPWHSSASLSVSLRAVCKCGPTVVMCHERNHCLNSIIPQDVFTAACKLLKSK